MQSKPLLSDGQGQQPRFCTECRMSREILGGEWRSFNKGRNRRWVCVECVKRREERQRGREQAGEN